MPIPKSWQKLSRHTRRTEVQLAQKNQLPQRSARPEVIKMNPKSIQTRRIVRRRKRKEKGA